MIRLILRAAPARFRAAPALALLSVSAIALGVGTVLAVNLLNRAAMETLDASLEVVSGTTDIVVRGLRVEPASLPDEAWPRALGTPGVMRVAPLVRLPGVILGRGDASTRITLTGVDVLTGSFRFGRGGDSGELLSAGIALPSAAAAWIGAGVGDAVRVSHGGRSHEATVAHVFESGDSSSVAFTDLAVAQDIRGRAGLDRLEIELLADEDPEAVARRIEAAAPGVVATTTGALRDQGAALFAAFRLNLRALGAVSLLVAAFLIYASVRAGLLARRQELGLLRALGASGNRLAVILAGEVVVTALIGAVIGIPLAALGARAALDGVSRTLTNFYLLERVEGVAVSFEGVLMALAVGVLAALAGAAPEILAEARRPPVELLRPGREPASRSARRLPFDAAGAMGVALVAFAVFAVAAPEGPTARPGGGFAAAAALLAGSALLTGFVLRAGSRLRSDRSNSFLRGMADALREPSGSAPPAAALVVAVAMLVGVSALIGSFRNTLDGWLLRTLAADIYVSRSGEPGAVARERLALPVEVLEAVRGDPDVVERDLLRALRIRVDGRPVSLLGVSASLSGAGERFVIVGDSDEALRGFRNGGVLVSEPLARRRGIGPGDRISLPVAAGEQAVSVVGVYRDYGNEIGSIFMDRSLLNRLYPAEGPPVHGAALLLREGADPGEVMARMERRFGGKAELTLNRSLRARALEVFDQTMSVTGLLRGAALLIAALGLGLALFTISREQAPQIALQRALGASRGQVALCYLGRGVLIALAGLGIGGGAGVLLTLLLVEVVNPAWFGWRLDLHWPIGVLAAQGALVLLVALAAAAIPAREAARTGAAALRREL